MGGRHAFRIAAPLGLEGPEAQLMWEHGCRGVEQRDGEIVGYFDAPVELPLPGAWEELQEVDFLETYYRGLDAIDLGPLVIAPTHREARLSAGQKVLWIDPGMAFGTGHHETTRLALRALADRDLRGRRVLDLGAGSGILAIAADLLGAQESRGLDIDESTVPVARQNADLNRSRATFGVGTLNRDEECDLLVANLYAELHVELAAGYAAAVRQHGELLLTGIMAERADIVEQALGRYFDVLEWSDEGGWRLLAARRA